MNKLLPRLTRLFFAILFTHFSTIAYGTHIVGGELELQHIQGDRYQLGLILYFDNISGLPGARDPNATVFIFRKSDDELVNQFTLPRVSNARVPYTSPDCAVGSLSTDRLYYRSTVRLREISYNDPEGYYIVYERCCRNGSIQNIFDPGGAGQAFYLEFPAVVKDTQPFINSSPQLFPPLSDYACVNQPFQFNFGGTDLDGDSLVYSLATPLNGHSSRNQPVPDFPQSAPYEPIQFLDGYSIASMIPGKPPLQIDAKTGFLEVTAAETGLFVFSVRCEEYRDGEKIGEVVRDFQMLVLDCPSANSPTVFAEDKDGLRVQVTDTLIYEPGRIDNCLKLFVTDPDSLNTIRTSIIPIGFQENDFTIVGERNRIMSGADTLVYDFCLDECPMIVNETYEVLVLVEDNTCSLPLKDTMSVFIRVDEPNNPPDIFSEDLVLQEDTECYYAELKTDEEITFTVTGTDPDGDPVKLYAIGEGFDLKAEGMEFTADSALAEVTSTFTWEAVCENLLPNTDERIFDLKFIVGDIGVCGIKDTDTICVQLKLINDPPPNTSPELSTDKFSQVGEAKVFYDTIRIGEEYTLNLQSFDIDGDSIRLEGEAIEQSFSDLNIFFGNVSGFGLVSSRFFWKPTCSQIPEVENGATSATFEFKFVTKDYKPCSKILQDSLTLFLVVLYEPTARDAPNISIEGAEFNEEGNYFEATVTAGDDLILDINGEDEERDLLNMFVNAVGFDAGSIGMDFRNTAGLSPVSSTLTWPTSCASFNDSTGNEYKVQVIVENIQSCGVAAADTIELKINLVDTKREAIEQFPNAFSPDGNGVNDFFEVLLLPADLCTDSFEFIEVTNRWGDVVFFDEKRDFRWAGDNHPEGTYYYFIKYTNTSYKGLINLLRVTE